MPHSVLILAVLANFPFAIDLELETGGINGQASHRALAGRRLFDVTALARLLMLGKSEGIK